MCETQGVVRREKGGETEVRVQKRGKIPAHFPEHIKGGFRGFVCVPSFHVGRVSQLPALSCFSRPCCPTMTV